MMKTVQIKRATYSDNDLGDKEFKIGYQVFIRNDFNVKSFLFIHLGQRMQNYLFFCKYLTSKYFNMLEIF